MADKLSKPKKIHVCDTLEKIAMISRMPIAPSRLEYEDEDSSNEYKLLDYNKVRSYNTGEGEIIKYTLADGSMCNIIDPDDNKKKSEQKKQKVTKNKLDDLYTFNPKIRPKLPPNFKKQCALNSNNPNFFAHVDPSKLDINDPGYIPFENIITEDNPMPAVFLRKKKKTILNMYD